MISILIKKLKNMTILKIVFLKVKTQNVKYRKVIIFQKQLIIYLQIKQEFIYIYEFVYSYMKVVDFEKSSYNFSYFEKIIYCILLIDINISNNLRTFNF